MVQGLLADLQAKQNELYHRTDPANLALELRNHNVGNDAVDSLSAHLSQTVENFEKIKREMNSKAGSADVAAAIQGMQQKFRGFVGETFSKDELSSVLSTKVDKREVGVHEERKTRVGARGAKRRATSTRAPGNTTYNGGSLLIVADSVLTP